MEESKRLAEIAALLARVKQLNPLVHQITNYVTANDCANMTLAVGASPVMAQEMAEVAEMAEQARALVVNIGTVQSNVVGAMFTAAARAKALSIPVVFDPVGAGATGYRTGIAKRFLREASPDIVRCNMSELKVLCGMDASVKGVDSTAECSGGESAARELAKRVGGVVAVTGKKDIVTDGETVIEIANGCEMLTKVTGTGCMTTALTACFAGVGDTLTGAAAGICCMGIAGEIAASSLRKQESVGTFKTRLFDAVYNLDGGALRDMAKFSEWMVAK